jgi:hypothetical protein
MTERPEKMNVLRRSLSVLAAVAVAGVSLLSAPSPASAEDSHGLLLPCTLEDLELQYKDSVRILSHADTFGPKGDLVPVGNDSDIDLPAQVEYTKRWALTVETSVSGGVEVAKIVGAAIQASIATQVVTETATKVSVSLKIPPRSIGYVQAYARTSLIVFENVQHVAVLNMGFHGLWCMRGTWTTYRWAKVPVSSIVCVWYSPATKCSREVLLAGGGGGAAPGGGTAAPPPGPQPVTSVYGLADGTLMRASDSGRIYKMVGGAPVWQATCADSICAGEVRPTTQAVVDAGPSTPRNGSSAIDQRGRVYLFVGGAPIWQDSCGAPVTCGSPVKISDWSIDARDHMSQTPADGQLVQARSDGTDLPVAVTAGGALIPFQSPQEVMDAGFGSDWPSKVVAISGNSYNLLGFTPADGTLVQGSGAGGPTPVAMVLGNARINFSTPQEVIDAGYGANWASKVRAIPARHFHAMPTVPRDGTLVQGSNGSTPVAAMVGSARVNFANPQELIDAGYGTDWASKVRAIPERAFNEIRTSLIDGTRIGRAGGGSQGGIVGGAVVPFASDAELNEAGYANKPLYWVPPRVWDSLPTKIANGTRIGRAGGGSQGAITGGAVVAFASEAELAQAGYADKPLFLIPPRVWDSLPTKIADGTRIGRAGGTSQAAVVGGAVVPFVSEAELSQAGYSSKLLLWVPPRVWDSLPTKIADGTRIGRAGGTSQAAVVGGAVVPFVSEAELTQTGYASKTLYWIPPRVWDGTPTNIADGTLIKAPDSSAVWLVTGGRRTASTATGTVWTVPARVVATIPVA